MLKLNLSVPSPLKILTWLVVGAGVLGVLGMAMEQLLPSADYFVIERPVVITQTVVSEKIPTQVIDTKLEVKAPSQKQVTRFEKKYETELGDKNIVGEFKLGHVDCEYTFEFLETHDPVTGKVEHKIKATRKFFQLGGKWGVGVGVGWTNRPGVDSYGESSSYRLEIPLRLEKDLFRTGSLYWNGSVEADLASDVRKTTTVRLMTIYRF